VKFSARVRGPPPEFHGLFEWPLILICPQAYVKSDKMIDEKTYKDYISNNFEITTEN